MQVKLVANGIQQQGSHFGEERCLCLTTAWDEAEHQGSSAQAALSTNRVQVTCLDVLKEVESKNVPEGFAAVINIVQLTLLQTATMPSVIHASGQLSN